jgi:PAS domain S-box-containing protein
MSSSEAEPILILQHSDGLAAQLLVEAGDVLSRSLDLDTTMDRVARLTVPRLADLCVIDLSEEDGSIRKVAVVAAEPDLASELEELRLRYPLDPDGEHPVARVIRSGQPELLAQMSSELLKAFAQGSEHARFMIEHGYRSAVVAPLRARGRTLGTLSLLRLGAGEPYEDAHLELGCELAGRAALAIDNARLFSDLQRVEQRLEAILASLAEAVTVVDRQGRTVFANQAAADLLGVRSPADLTGAPSGSIMPRFIVLDGQGRELDLHQMPTLRLFAGERVEPLLVRNIVPGTGEERWLLIRSSPIEDRGTGLVRYAVNVFENITEVKRAELAESFMAEASRLLASSMDYGETLRQIARLAVPQIADWCAVDVLDERGELERVATHHADPAKLALIERLERDYRPALDEQSGVPEVIRTGQAKIFTDIGPEALAGYARDAEHLELLRAIDASAAIIVPLAAPARTIGALTLVSSQSTRRLTRADLGLAVRLGRRAGTAVESARLYTERTRIARTLESALLPEALPQIPGVELAALYRAAGELNDAGGDFYDVFALDGDRWMFVIGDVCGKGARAAGVTALARHTLRTAAMLGQAPSEMLDTLHRALRRQPPGADLCTVCLVVMDLSCEQPGLTIALAGHPLPLILDRHGEARQVSRSGTLLGVVDPLHISEVTVELHAGETLLLYTDGLPEAGRSGGQLAERELLELCARSHQPALPVMLERLVGEASARAGQRLHDDIALVAVRPIGDRPPA